MPGRSGSPHPLPRGPGTKHKESLHFARNRLDLARFCQVNTPIQSQQRYASAGGAGARGSCRVIILA